MQWIQDNHQMPSGESLTIGQVAKRAGINAKAIRYYEDIGVLPRPVRSDNQYRRYNQTDLNRLILLRRIRFLGVPLSSAQSLLSSVSDARCIEVQQELLGLVRQRLMVIDQEMAELHLFRQELEGYQQELVRCQPDEQEPFRMCIDMSCIATERSE